MILVNLYPGALTSVIQGNTLAKVTEPFGPDITDRTSIMTGFQAINEGRLASQLLLALERGEVEHVKQRLRSLVEVGSTWETMQQGAMGVYVEEEKDTK